MTSSTVLTVVSKHAGGFTGTAAQKKIRKRLFFKMEISLEMRADDFTDSIKKLIKEKFLNNQ